MNLANTGSGNAGFPASACYIRFGGVSVSGFLYYGALGTGGKILSLAGNTAPSAAYYYVAAGLPVGASGSTAGGSIVTSSATVPFSGVWK